MQDTTGTIIDVLVKVARMAMTAFGWIQRDHRSRDIRSIMARKAKRRAQHMMLTEIPLTSHHQGNRVHLVAIAIAIPLVLG